MPCEQHSGPSCIRQVCSCWPITRSSAGIIQASDAKQSLETNKERKKETNPDETFKKDWEFQIKGFSFDELFDKLHMQALMISV